MSVALLNLKKIFSTNLSLSLPTFSLKLSSILISGLGGNILDHLDLLSSTNLSSVL